MFTYINLKNFLSFGDVKFEFKRTAKNAKQFVAIYGENGSGKSNFVRSIDLLCRSLTSFDTSKKTNEVIDALKNIDDKTPNEIIGNLLRYGDIQQYIASCRMLDCEEPTEVEYGFLLNGYEGHYNLTFSEQFTRESLYFLMEKQRGYLFDISYVDEKIKTKFWSELIKNENLEAELLEELEKFWGKHTFLSILLQRIEQTNKSYVIENISNSLLDVIDLFMDTTVISKTSNRYNTGVVSQKPFNVLDNLRRGKIPKDMLPQLECSERVLREFFTQTYADIKDVYYEKEFADGKFIKYQLFVDKMIAGKVRRINFEHESAGTQQILDIVKMLLGLFCGVVVVYDEIDNGIHDVLLNNIIGSMMNEISGQLIITTHNTMLLESIDIKSAYVIQVDYMGNKEVNCLGDFKIQNNNNARIRYLKGLYGGTPYIDGIDYDAIIGEIDDFKGGQ